MSDKTVGSPISLEELRQVAQKVFGQRPCLWQLRVAEAILQRKQDVILTAATGAGKTLTFWIPLLAKPDSIQIVCAPLNILGTINVRALAKHGICAITVTAENVSSAIFRVCHCHENARHPLSFRSCPFLLNNSLIKTIIPDTHSRPNDPSKR